MMPARRAAEQAADALGGVWGGLWGRGFVFELFTRQEEFKGELHMSHATR